MISEVAIDPAVVGRDERLRLFLEMCGFEKGRLISRFPGDWERLVLNSDSSCGDVERQRMVEKLRLAKQKLVSRGRIPEKRPTWLESAEAQHQQREFGVVVATDNPRNREWILHPDDAVDSNPRWRVEPSIRVRRRASELARALEMVLKVGREVLFVDRNFDPRLDRWTAPLKRFLRVLREADKPARRIEYHVDADRTQVGPVAEFEAACHDRLRPILRKDQSLTVVLWSAPPNSDGIHARYVLTDRGGVGVEWGLDEAAYDTTRHTDIWLLGQALYEERWAQFQEGTTKFKRVARFEVRPD